MKKYNDFINENLNFIPVRKDESIWDKHGENLPSIFRGTIYRIPTDDELKEFSNYPDLSAHDICCGFGFTIVGRGIVTFESNKTELVSIQKLCEIFPDNLIYKEALEECIEYCEKYKNKIKYNGKKKQ